MKQETIDSLLVFLNDNHVPPNLKEVLGEDWPGVLENIIRKAPYLMDKEMLKELPQERIFEYLTNYANWSPQAALREAIEKNDPVLGTLAVDAATLNADWKLAYEGKRHFKLEDFEPEIKKEFAKNYPVEAYHAATKEGRDTDEELLRAAFPYLMKKDVKVAENAAIGLKDNKLLSQAGYALIKSWPCIALQIAYQLQDQKLEDLCKKHALKLAPYIVFELGTSYKKDDLRKEAAQRLIRTQPQMAINLGNELKDQKLREKGFAQIKKLPAKESLSKMYKIDNKEIKAWILNYVIEHYKLGEAAGIVKALDYSYKANW